MDLFSLQSRFVMKSSFIISLMEPCGGAMAVVPPAHHCCCWLLGLFVLTPTTDIRVTLTGRRGDILSLIPISGWLARAERWMMRFCAVLAFLPSSP